jgi:hypothetical protein
MRTSSAEIVERDQWRCVRCGVFCGSTASSVHHLVLGNRSNNVASNLILLCGSGTTGCHGWVHAHPKKAREGGWIRSRHAQSPADMPVLYDQPGRKGWYLLDDDLQLTLYEGGEGQ